MTKAIENIVAGYAGTWISMESLTSALQEEIGIVDAALKGLEEGAGSIN